MHAIKITKQGNDVLGTANTYNDYIFNSDLNTFKIINQGTFSGTVSGSPTTFQLAHNQGTTPAFFSFAKFPDGYVAMPNEKERADSTSGPQRYYFSEADSTNLYFPFYKGTTANYVVSVSYFIFEAPL
jgi:hypothetical protein